MALAAGQLPRATSVIYQPDAPQYVRAVRLVNQDAGTAYCTVNVYLRLQGKALVAQSGKSQQLGAGDMIEVPIETDMIPGDVLEADVSDGSFVDYTVV